MWLVRLEKNFERGRRKILFVGGKKYSRKRETKKEEEEEDRKGPSFLRFSFLPSSPQLTSRGKSFPCCARASKKDTHTTHTHTDK